MKRSQVLVVAVLLGVLGLGLSNVATAGKKDKVKGKDLYKEYCKPCHDEGSEHGEYTPMTLIQEQWERFFEDKYVAAHQEVTDPNHENKKVTDLISDDYLAKIKKFAVDHAADSEQPMTCG